LSHLAGEYKILDETNICSYNERPMASAQAKRPTRDLLRELTVIVETTAGRLATGTAAASAELAIARDIVRLMLASADSVSVL